MLSIRAFAILLLMCGHSFAGSITYTAQPGNVTKTFTLSDAQILRMLAVYGPYCKAQKIVGGVPTDCNNTEIGQYWITDTMNKVVAFVLREEQNNAASAASAGVTPLTPQ